MLFANKEGHCKCALTIRASARIDFYQNRSGHVDFPACVVIIHIAIVILIGPLIKLIIGYGLESAIASIITITPCKHSIVSF